MRVDKIDRGRQWPLYVISALFCLSISRPAVAAGACDKLSVDPRGRVVTLTVSQADADSLVRGDSGGTARRLIDDQIYACFNDSFDFINLVVNQDYRASAGASQLNVRPGSTKSSRLKAALIFPERNQLTFGATLHEIGHTWFNRLYDNMTVQCQANGSCTVALDPQNTGHWGVADVHGVVGGFDKKTLTVSPKAGQPTTFQVDNLSDRSCGPNACPYAPLELYLMGLAPKRDVPITTRYTKVSNMTRASVIRFAGCDEQACQAKYAGLPRAQWCSDIAGYRGNCAAGQFAYGPAGNRTCYDVGANPRLVCDQVESSYRYSFQATPETLTADRISALAVQKQVPGFTDAGYTGQPKTFRVLTVLVTTQAPSSTELDEVDLSVDWLTHPGADSGYAGRITLPGTSQRLNDMSQFYNFWEATQGRARLDGGNLGAEKKGAAQYRRTWERGGCREHFSSLMQQLKGQTVEGCAQACQRIGCKMFQVGRSDDTSGRVGWCNLYKTVCTNNGDPTWDAYTPGAAP